jgi:hypothetical protein
MHKNLYIRSQGTAIGQYGCVFATYVCKSVNWMQTLCEQHSSRQAQGSSTLPERTFRPERAAVQSANKTVEEILLERGT